MTEREILVAAYHIAERGLPKLSDFVRTANAMGFDIQAIIPVAIRPDPPAPVGYLTPFKVMR